MSKKIPVRFYCVCFVQSNSVIAEEQAQDKALNQSIMKKFLFTTVTVPIQPAVGMKVDLDSFFNEVGMTLDEIDFMVNNVFYITGIILCNGYVEVELALEPPPLSPSGGGATT